MYWFEQFFLFIKEDPDEYLVEDYEFLNPEEKRKILAVVEKYELTSDKLEKILSERKEKLFEKEEKQWVPECEPDAVAVRIQEVELNKVVTPDLSGQRVEKETVPDEKSMNKNEKEKIFRRYHLT